MVLSFRIVATVLTATFFALAAEADSLPTDKSLAPGKPAGIQKAQVSTPDSLIFIGAGIGIIALGFYLANGPKVNTSGANPTTGTQ